MAGASFYIPSVFRNFQGFHIRDIKDFRQERRMELILQADDGKDHICSRCEGRLGRQDGRYWVEALHLRCMGWLVKVCFWREKRYCPSCRKIRSEWIPFISDVTPHVTEEMAFWISKLTEITSVLRVSKLESLDKQTCYNIDRAMLIRFLQNYKIPPVTMITVDEVYARGPKQLKEGETRDDLFLTTIVDLKTHKVLWVSQSRRKEALDEFFQILGPEACQKIEVVATDQHADYAASVSQHCPNATLVWDRFHLVQNFNDALNEERKEEFERMDPEGPLEDLASGKYRYIFLTKAKNRTDLNRRHIDEVMKHNQRIAKMEVIKERFHQFFEANTEAEAADIMFDIFAWSKEADLHRVVKWIEGQIDKAPLWNYFKYKVSTGLSEGINRVIKGIKWQAYGYKDMHYFALKIMQKAGYLNTHFIGVTG